MTTALPLPDPEDQPMGTLCPACGDQAFFIELDELGVGFKCDSNPYTCAYEVWSADDPAVMELAVKLGWRVGGAKGEEEG